MEVSTSLGEESLKPLKKYCALDDDDVKHSKSLFEALGEQRSMMDCQLFNMFRAT
jgi:hypothetical protein